MNYLEFQALFLWVNFNPKKIRIMKKLCAILLLLAAGCSAPSTTEINRPTPDVNGTRQLLLTTFFISEEGEFASAAYSDSTVKGFGPNVVITCNSDTIVNTLQISGSPDTERFIEESTSYIWSYQGPDTSFEFTMSSSGDDIQIIDPEEDTLVEPFFGDSLSMVYEPAGPCSNLQVIWIGFINGETEDTVRPKIQFNPATGTIAPISLDTISQLNWNGQGAISIVKVTDSTFALPSIHAVTVKDSTISQPSEIRWED
jgi:hypothetical protein